MSPSVSPTQSPTLLEVDDSEAVFPKWEYISEGLSYKPDVLKFGLGNILSVDDDATSAVGASGEDINGPAILSWKVESAPSEGKSISLGLSSGSATQAQTDWRAIDCMIDMGSRQINIVENGTRPFRSNVDYATSDQFALVLHEDGIVTFYVNGYEYGSCPSALSFPAHIDVSFSGDGAIDFGGLIQESN